MSDASFPTKYGEFTVHSCEGCGAENLALIYGAIRDPALVRVHSKCTTGDVFY